jgi:threonine/homoserine/homoserine lactone efflux protein
MAGMCRVLLSATAMHRSFMFFLAILPQFIDPARGSTAAQSALLGVICVSSGTAVNLVTACTAARISVRLRASTRAQERFQQVSGTVLMVVALRLLLEQTVR